MDGGCCGHLCGLACPCTRHQTFPGLAQPASSGPGDNDHRTPPYPREIRSPRGLQQPGATADCKTRTSPDGAKGCNTSAPSITAHCYGLSPQESVLRFHLAVCPRFFPDPVQISGFGSDGQSAAVVVSRVFALSSATNATSPLATALQASGFANATLVVRRCGSGQGSAAPTIVASPALPLSQL